MECTKFYKYLDFTKCKSREDIVREIEHEADLFPDIYLADDEDDAEDWLLRPLRENGEDIDEIEIDYADVYCDTIIIHNDDGDSEEYRLRIKAYYTDPGSADYAYEYFLSENVGYCSPY